MECLLVIDNSVYIFFYKYYYTDKGMFYSMNINYIFVI
uniref:Uncharacterized protein n=1 Tax=viral metagenome TaxID=1070528 RepID=A0A6C0HI82_9ZZZZ